LAGFADGHDVVFVSLAMPRAISAADCLAAKYLAGLEMRAVNKIARRNSFPALELHGLEAQRSSIGARDERLAR
jgi:hypothetical protein